MYTKYKVDTEISFEDFKIIFLKFLRQEPKHPNSFLTEEDVNQLTEEESVSKNADEHSKTWWYPYAPFYKHICKDFYNWCLTGNCKYSQMPKFYMLEEGDYVDERCQKFADATEIARGISSLWHHWSCEEKIFAIRSLLLRLGGLRGILDLLGLRQTAGTQLQIPPTRTRLMSAFDLPCNNKSSLSQGARALTKHFHRDDSASFWGVATGQEADKNRQARSVVLKILNSAAWINIHQLPGQLPIMEVRHFDGYGARWDPNGDTFRGFLEPMQPEGWLNKYRH